MMKFVLGVLEKMGDLYPILYIEDECCLSIEHGESVNLTIGTGKTYKLTIPSLDHMWPNHLENMAIMSSSPPWNVPRWVMRSVAKHLFIQFGTGRHTTEILRRFSTQRVKVWSWDEEIFDRWYDQNFNGITLTMDGA
jgi:hypothetical protein